VSQPIRARGVWPFYLVFLAGLGVSVNTSWRFFDLRLHIPMDYGERPLMFAVLELALIACGWSMRAAVRRKDGTPGPARLLAWALCGFSAYMAIDLSGVGEGIARVLLGPVLAIIGLHLALGIELRAARGGAKTGTWSRIVGEMRERFLSRLGLGDDTRMAAERTRDRAADRVARLATGSHVAFRRTRLARAIKASEVALNLSVRSRMLAQVAAYRHLDDLRTLILPSPWTTPEPEVQPELPAVAPTEPAPALGRATVPPSSVGTDLVLATPTAEALAEVTGEYSLVGGENGRNNGRKQRRPAPETLRLAQAMIGGGLERPEAADLLGITDRRLREVLAEAQPTQPARINGHNVINIDGEG
jgi:hypothetical protein